MVWSDFSSDGEDVNTSWSSDYDFVYSPRHHHHELPGILERKKLKKKEKSKKKAKRFRPVQDLILESLESLMMNSVDEEEEESIKISWGSFWWRPYSFDQKILLVGEGDFSFSTFLARSFGDASNMIATSLNAVGFLMRNYGRAASNIEELTSRGCKVMHRIDATKMANHPQLRSFKFDCIVFNFPYSDFANREVTRDARISLNQELVRGFMANAKTMIEPEGQIHITCKFLGFFSEWHIKLLGSIEGLRLVEESPFNFRHYPGYRTKHGRGGDRNFRSDPAKRYIFQLDYDEVTQERESWMMNLVDEEEDEFDNINWESLWPYNLDQKILFVGEGDFSFSACLARSFGDASNMIATSLNSIEFLVRNYKNAVSNIEELTCRGCKVMHQVDATKMANHPELRCLKFDCIVYNFPHAGFAYRHDPNISRQVEISKHQELVRGFMSNAKTMIKADGQIHITHKCQGFFLEWNLEMLGSIEGLRLVEELPFNLREYPGYRTKYGFGGDNNFDCNPSKRYIFGFEENVTQEQDNFFW